MTSHPSHPLDPPPEGTYLFVARTLVFGWIAGQALLTLGMISPTGNPVSELSYKKTKVGMYTVSYKADEKGDHTLTIRWGPNDIPGSPFKIPIG